MTMMTPEAVTREIVLLTHADTDLATLRLAAAALDDPGTALRGLSLHAVSHGDAMHEWLDTGLGANWIVVVRLLGRADEVPGLATLAARARDAGGALVVLSGTGETDPELDRLSNVPADVLRDANAYWLAGGVDNVAQCLRYLSDRLWLTALGYEAPRALSQHGVYRADTAPAAALDAFRSGRRAGAAAIGVLFYRAHWTSGNLRFIDALVAALEQRGADVLPVFTHSLRETGADDFPLAFGLFEQAGGIDLLINTTRSRSARPRSTAPRAATPAGRRCSTGSACRCSRRSRAG